MNKKWILAAIAVTVISFSSCKDDDMSQEDMYGELMTNGSDRIFLYGLKGDVETMTESTYSDVKWENNAIKKGKESEQDITYFDREGFVTGYAIKSLVPVSVQWAKDKQNKDILIVTSEFKVVKDGSNTLDDKHRSIQVLSKSTSYTTKVGDYLIYGYQDTIPYVDMESTVKVGDPLKSGSPVMTNYFKNVITYNDATGTAVRITSSSEDGKTYKENSKYEYPLNEFGKIDYLFASEGPNRDRKEVIPTYATTVKRDDKGNVSEMVYMNNTSGSNPWIYSYATFSYTYY